MSNDMISIEAISIWMGWPKECFNAWIKKYLPGSIGKMLTQRLALIVAVGTFLDLNFKAAESFYYKHIGGKNARIDGEARAGFEDHPRL